MTRASQLLFLTTAPLPLALGQDVGARSSSIGACSCPDPILGEGVCYEPVCPSGYYKCCSTCKASTCADHQTMEYSWRGILECILCPPGDFCDGCDTLKTCPESDREGREGPRVTPAGATRVAECETCGVGMEASYFRNVCVDLFKSECTVDTDTDYMERCIRHCSSEDITRRKELSECEKMKCQMYCAKQFDDQFDGHCVEQIKPQCLFLTNSPDAGSALVEGAGLQMIEGCNVNCNAAMPRWGSTAPLIAAVLSTSALYHIFTTASPF